MLKKWLVNTLSLVLIIGLLAGCGARSQSTSSDKPSDDGTKAKEEKIVIKFSHVVAENTPKGQAAQMFKELAEKYTDGRVEVQIFPNSTLYTDEDVLAAIQQNNVQLAAPATSAISSLFPEWQLFDLPFVFTSEEAVQKAMESEEIGGKLFSMLKDQKLLGLAMWDNGFKQMSLNDHPLVTPKDFEGSKFRTMPSKVLEAQFHALKANPIALPFGEVYSALEQGVIDGQENTLSNIYSKKLHEVQKYLTMSNHGYLGYAVITNSDFWDGLPADIRTQVEKALDESTQWIRENSKQLNQEELEKIKADGTTEIIELTPEQKKAWMDATDVVYDQFKDIIGADLINAVLDLRN